MKKNDRAYLQDLKIDIRVKNSLAFQEIALLVDKPDFLNLLPLLRNDLGVVNLVSLDEFMDVAYDRPFHSKEKKKINFSKYKGAEKLKSFMENNESIYGSGGLDKKMDMFQLIATEISLVCIQFNRPPYFAEVIRQAIYCGATDETGFYPTSTEVLESSNVFPTASYFKLPQVAILISPTTTYEELKEVYRNAKNLYKTDKRLIYYQPRVDITPNIKKYREWYWERIRKKENTYQKIADEWEQKHDYKTGVTYLDVLKAVKTYEKLLAS